MLSRFAELRRGPRPRFQIRHDAAAPFTASMPAITAHSGTRHPVYNLVSTTRTGWRSR
jgi:hypothetical protein